MSTNKMPSEFCFCPSNEVLINFYLLNKTMGNPLPSDVIIERDLYSSDSPWQILTDDAPWIASGDNKKKSIYVFTCLKYVSKTCRNRIARTAGCGSWMAKTGPKNIVNRVTGELIGTNKMLVFETNDETLEGMRGQWSMHEFVLAGSSLDFIGERSLDKIYVICKITKDDSKLLKILPLPTRMRKESVSGIKKIKTHKSHINEESDGIKSGSSKEKSSLPKSPFELEDSVAKSVLQLDISTKENEINSQEYETQNNQEWSSLTVSCAGMEHNGFHIQISNEIVYNYESYEDDVFAGSDILFDTSELLELLEADSGTKPTPVCAQEPYEVQTNKKMRFSDFNGTTSTSMFSHMEGLLW